MSASCRGARSTLAALAGCIVLLLSGCGAGGPTKARYVASADSICRSTGAEMAPLVEHLTAATVSLGSGARGAADELSSALTQLHGTAASALAKLRSLEQPSADRVLVERFLGSLASVDGALAAAGSYAGEGNPQLALATLQRAAPAVQQAVDAAGAYGMVECESVLSALGSAAWMHPLDASIVGESHEPTVSRPWRYAVTVTDAEGNRLSGTETTQYTFNGAVVGTEKPQNVAFANGVYHDTIEFPAAAVGYPLAVRAVVHTALGTATAEWPVTVQR